MSTIHANRHCDEHNAPLQESKALTSILFVCLGNICRSPLAEGVFRTVLSERGIADIEMDSAGTGGWHAGELPDPRSIAIGAKHSVNITDQRARKVMAEDFARFDLILGMDRSNVRDLLALAPKNTGGRVQLYLDYTTGRQKDVPDPYYGGGDGFADVYRMIRDASEKLADKLTTGRISAASGQASSTM
ncbi:low molecular weight protein-tyrosine-phosphatase [Corticibacterium sp. UT-5YL-CI-8]|nr:low molecular weight protein-tyrosine-phosphatase [Tianweitania sp. UT-5YL-CI-8]